MALAGPQDAAKVVVCGPAEGVAGILAGSLKEEGGRREVVLVDGTQSMDDALEGATALVLCSDAGPGAQDQGPDASLSALNSLPASAKYVLCVDSPGAREVAAAAERDAAAEEGPLGALGALFGGGSRDVVEAARGLAGGAQAVVLHTGRLFGVGAVGKEPVPFVTGPKAEPVLDESYTRQAVLVGPGGLLAASQEAATKRSVVAEAIRQVLDGPERPKGLDLSLVSVEGLPTTDAEWAQELSRLEDERGVAVFAMDFESLPKRDTLLEWLADQWGPATLRKASVSMVRSGARPVRVMQTEAGAEVVWETLDDNLMAVVAGKLEMAVTADPPQMRVLRVSGSGQPLPQPLVGEEEIVQGLIEGVNSVAYTKGYAVRKATRAAPTGADESSRAPATAAAATTNTASTTPAPPAAPAAPAIAPPERKGRGRRAGSKRKR